MASMTDSSISERILNKEQKKAVRFGSGPLLIIAGAGTGKTTVITERIKYLILSKKANPQEILALTFTEKASREMEERIDLAMPYGTTQMWISTFHAFCDRILRNESLAIGLDPNYKLMSEAETIQFFKDHLFDFKSSYFRPLGNPTKFILGMLQHFNRLKDEDVDPTAYIAWVGKQKTFDGEEKDKYQELAYAYRTYEELKIKASVVDYADLIANTLKVFRLRKKILEGYQKKFKYILIDEFQDTNIAQNQLAILLSGTKKNITVVGDDDQAIYRWRGAAISNIIQFRKHFKKAKVIVLTKNYRSTQEILNRSYQLIQHNNPDRLEVAENIDKQLECIRRINGDTIRVLYMERVEDEAEAVAKEIKKITDQGHTYKDSAILVRANNHAEPFVRALGRAGIPYQFLGPGQLFKQPEVKDIIGYLKVLYDIHDSVAMYRVLTMDVLRISPRDVAEIVSYAKQHTISIFSACEEQQENIPTVKSVVAMIHKHLGLIKKDTAGQIAYYFLQDSGLLQSFTSVATAKDQRKAENIEAFFSKLKTYEVDHEDASVFRVVDWLDLSMDLGESPIAANTDWSETDAVNILTIHSAKGLEFSVVFLVNLVSARFPTNERHEQIPIPDDMVKEILPVGDYHTEEERRLFYVGMTRARDMLYMTGAQFYGDGKREKKLSPFIEETIGNQQVLSVTKAVNEKQLFLIDWKQNPETEKRIVVPKSSYLWYTHIESFRRCPLQYKYRYVIKIPVPTSAVLGFGDIMHKTMQEFYQQVLRGDHQTKEGLLAIYEQKWKSNGFMSKTYENEMKKHGEDLLKGYFNSGYDPKTKTIAVEQGFKIKITKDVTLGGRIDRVDRKRDGTLEIIDYKTGAAPKKRDVSEDFQLSLYALAATDKGVFGEKPDNIIVSFYFFEGQERMSGTRSKIQLEKVKESIVTSATDIGASTFQPTPGIYCSYCEFRLICEAWK
jgi:DNA helicase-2/ATP-dependent DNA helicase PcrA